MNGPQHYAEAERLIQMVGSMHVNDPAASETLACAQIHATLAQTAAIIDVDQSLAHSLAWAEVTE